MKDEIISLVKFRTNLNLDDAIVLETFLSRLVAYMAVGLLKSEEIE